MSSNVVAAIAEKDSRPSPCTVQAILPKNSPASDHLLPLAMRRLLSQCPRPLLGLLVVACALRIAVIVWRFDELSVDRDRYGTIARNLVNGEGFCTEPGRPTAFRPPLYPVLLAACRSIDGVTLVAAFHVLLGTVTVGMTWYLAQRLGFASNARLVAAVLVAVDPLLLLYSTQLMTETLFTFLVTGLLLSLQHVSGSRQAAIAGMFFGLAALCRPTIWAFAVLAVTVSGIGFLRHRAARRPVFPGASRRLAAIFALSAGVIISPWVVRNLVVLDHPIVMTTHGGYTLLLGNNPVFYAEVVARPENPVWQKDSLSVWQESLETQLESGESRLNERERSSQLQAMAYEWIRNHPREFLACASLRLRRLWSPGPENVHGISPMIAVTVRSYYLLVFLLCLVGLARHRGAWRDFRLSAAFVVSLTLLHSVYWANARMRAPAIPVISVFAAAAFSSARRSLNGGDSSHDGIPSCSGD